MKKILALVLCLFMFSALVACSPKTNNDDETQKPTQSTEQTIPSDNETQTPDSEDEEKNDIIVDFSDTVPEGGIYYHNNPEWEGHRKIFEFALGEKIVAGQNMPEQIMDGDIFVYENMIYVYNAAFTDEGSYGLKKADLNGWSVYCGAARYIEGEMWLLNSINNKPVVKASYIFQGDYTSTELKKIVISENIKDISHLLDDCQLQGDLSIVLMGTPEKYKSCLNISADPILNEDKITFESTYVITVSGDCDETIKNAIAGETDVAMLIEVR